MIGVKEKLTELLLPFIGMRSWSERISNHLIANSVTVQEWIPVTERLPEADVAVLARCFYHESWRTLVCYMSKRNAGEWYTDEGCQWVKVTHWMPLPPELPKEEADNDKTN